ncbi:MAG: transcription-repair coupling factor [Dehalococcoidales bacterium]|nr:transcription-repair coupling factor [Dehalococcoidales bacterium]
MPASLKQLLQLIDDMPAYRQLVAKLNSGNNARAAMLEAAKPYVIAALYRSQQRPVMVVTAQPENSKRLYEQLLAWCDSGQIKLFPEPDALPYEHITAGNSTEMERLQVLSSLANVAPGDGESPVLPPLVVVSALALAQKTVPFRDFTAAVHTISQGMEAEPFQLLGRWQAMGYRLKSTVEVPGTMSHRGGIVDIYPPTGELPARLEFLGNTVNSIRLFDPADQRSRKMVESIVVGPAAELLTSPVSGEEELTAVSGAGMRERLKQELAASPDMESSDRLLYASLFNRDSILSYLPQDALLIIDEPENIKAAIEDLAAKAGELRAERLERGDLPPDSSRPYFTRDELEPLLSERQSLELTAWGTADSEPCYELNFSSAPSYAGQLPAFIKKVGQMLAEGQRLIVVSHQASRLAELLEEDNILAAPLTEVKQVPPPGSLTLVQGLLSEGWTMNGDTCLFTDAELFGFVKQHRQMKKRPVSHQKLFADITPGDYVVHVDHGIARFSGVTTRRISGNDKEYLVLEYAAGDTLYVPADQIDRVSRYIGSGERQPVLSRLGTQEWSRVKTKVKESVAEIARELLTLYAVRQVAPAFAFSPDTIWQQELEASFPYVETPDQMTVQKQVKADMEQAKPMDRLVCGDVGYGKTEVALRAAFKAVMDGKQVAVLVPTTVLAEQHVATFSQRMMAFPVRVEVLSRFRTAKEQQAIIDGLADGTVDICIGTHRLLQKDVIFKDLGLLIIDEEQRFGVVHKEYLKRMRREVDVLTLSATPIPRTLHMSLVGVRDMSIMETPPEERLPIKTYVAGYDERLVREAIIRELERNGQVFFIHNRVQSIALMAHKLRNLVPEARVAIAHGQMVEGELERVMADFVQGKSDVLLCTTIIESGLDLPNVNTLIVNQADKFGLTQLYQLRGRIGRGANLAHAYFLYDRGEHLTSTAEKRLRTIFEATELGAGLGIAMRDLEIRGAGTLLGFRQSGHISAIGFHLYSQLLAQAVEEEKARQSGITEPDTRPSRLPSPTVSLPLPAFIPEDYVPDLTTRLVLYHKMAALDSIEEVGVLGQEFTDRFGSMPAEVKNLLYVLKIKVMAARAGIESVSTDHGEIVMGLFEGMRFDKQKLAPFLDGAVYLRGLRLHLNPKRIGKEWRKVLEEVVGRVG